jgi:acylphosphatase
MRGFHRNTFLDSRANDALSSETHLEKRADPMTAHAKKIIVHGRVQGVGFRYFVQHVGNRIGLTGDVRNCSDSTVEIVVEGSLKKIADFLKEVERGPTLARVQRIDVTDIPVQGSYDSFKIERW